MHTILLLAACGGEHVLETVERDPELPLNYDAPGRDAPPEPLTLAEIEAAIPVALSEVFYADPRLIFAAQDEMMGQVEDSSCPAYNDYNYYYYGLYAWKDSCETEGGGVHGFAEFRHDRNFQYGGGDVWEYGVFGGDAQYDRGDGQTYNMAGFALWNDVDYGSYHYWQAQIAGTFQWRGEEWADTWLADRRSFYSNVQAYYYDIDAMYISIDGGVGGMEGRVNTVNFDNLLWYNEDYGATCWDEPGGVIAVRDDGGRWYQVVFDGHTFVGAGVFPPLCDGCGEVFLDGNSMGTVCPDLSPLYNWGAEGPWR